MKLKLTIIFIILFIGISSAQDAKISYSFDSVELSEVIRTIQNEHSINIYYKAAWLKDLFANGTYSADSYGELIKDLLNPHNLKHFVSGKHIVITNDIDLITQLVFDTTNSVQQSDYLFKREYMSSSGKEVTAIGKRSLMDQNEKAIIAGFIKDENGTPIENALIFSEENQQSVLTNSSGFFSIQLERGKHRLTFSHTGKEVSKKEVILFSDGSLNIILQDSPQILKEVTITSEKNATVNNLRMGTNTLNMESLKNVPKVLGENDMVQAALTLPGVQNVGEGAAGINVRGGKTDQNLIILNEATIYNPFHYFGFFSSFNADITSTSELMKSGIPASYGGRLSSLLNVKMKKASKEKFAAKIGISPITAKASVEIPLIKDQTSIMAGVRSTYSDWIINEIPDDNFRNSDPAFSDYALNINHSYGDNNSINMAVYYSRDKFNLSPDSTTSYSNLAGSVQWSLLFSDKLSMNLVTTFTKYKFDIDYERAPESAYKYGFEINEKFGKVVFNYFPDDRNEIQFGFDAKYYQLLPGEIKPSGESIVTPEVLPEEQGLERSIFLMDDLSFSEKLSVSGGLRYSFFSPFGEQTVSRYQPGVPKNNATKVDSTYFSSGEVINTFHGPEARLALKYSLTENSSIKAGFTQMRQYIHAISNTISVSPTDTWKLSDPNIKPQQSLQYSVGYYRNVFNGKVDLSVEGYYKQLKNILDYKIGADLVLNNNLETEIVQGTGKAYGIELLLRKNTGKLNGWVSYTYSRSLQKFDSQFSEDRINNGEFFPSNFEKPHDLSIVANYKATRRYSFSMNVVYSTGRPVTYPTGKYELDGLEITNFSRRNSFRIPNYFRVDLSINIEGSHKKDKPGHGYWSLSVYNVLARRNAYSIFFTNNNGEIEGYKLSVLGTAIPSITYNIKF